jgi:lysophospholipase L1-like esterase
MTRGRLWLFRLGAVLVGLVLVLAGVVALEAYASWRIRDAGWNVRGYRGRLVGSKAADEIRVFAIGGSTTYGYTVGPDDTYPHQLELLLAERYRSRGIAVTVVNLGHLSDSSVCYWPTYRDYAGLRPDVVIVYEGYNDVGRHSRRTEDSCYRNSSLIFRWTGFFPTFPIYLRERWYRLRYGSIEQGYRESARGPTDRPPRRRQRPETSPEDVYRTYEANVLAFVDRVLNRGQGVLFASQPYLGRPLHLDQQTRIRTALARYGEHPRFRYRDFLYLFGGTRDPAWFNGQMWLNPRGNRVLATQMAEPVAELIDVQLAARR